MLHRVDLLEFRIDLHCAYAADIAQMFETRVTNHIQVIPPWKKPWRHYVAGRTAGQRGDKRLPPGFPLPSVFRPAQVDAPIASVIAHQHDHVTVPDIGNGMFENSRVGTLTDIIEILRRDSHSFIGEVYSIHG